MIPFSYGHLNDAQLQFAFGALLDNTERLGLVKKQGDSRSANRVRPDLMDQGQFNNAVLQFVEQFTEPQIFMTDLGLRFVRACRS